MDKIKDVAKFVACTLIFWTLFPLLWLLCTPFYIFRLSLSFLQKAVHADWAGIVNIRDVFLYENPQSLKGLTHAIPTLLYVDFAPLDLDSSKIKDDDLTSKLRHEILAHIQRAFATRTKRGQLAYEKMTWYPVTWWGFPFWKRDEQFQLENHVKICPQFQGREVTEEEIDLFLTDHVHQPFPKDRSPWEVLLIRVKTEGQSRIEGPGQGHRARFAILFRFHHMLTDGLSILVLLGLGDPEKMSAKLKRLTLAKSSWRGKLWFALKFLYVVGNDVVNLLLVNRDRNCWRVPKGNLTSRVNVASSPALDYDLVKRASTKNGVSPTSILFGCFAGGIHNFLRAEGQSLKNLPKGMNIGVAMPVPNHPMEGLVNHWTFATVNLPVGDGDRSRRVRKIEENLILLMTRVTTGIMWLLVPLHTAVPTCLLDTLAYNDVTTLAGSNFPGPRTKIRVFNHFEVDSYRGYLPRLRGSTAVGLTSYTYNSTVRFSVCVDQGLLPDRYRTQQLAHHIQQELFALAEEETDQESKLK